MEQSTILNNNLGAIWSISVSGGDMVNILRTVSKGNSGRRDGQLYTTSDFRRSSFLKNGEEAKPNIMRPGDSKINMWNKLTEFIGKDDFNLLIFNKIKAGDNPVLSNADLRSNSWIIIFNVGRKFEIEFTKRNPAAETSDNNAVEIIRVPLEKNQILVMAAVPSFLNNYSYQFVIPDKLSRSFFYLVKARETNGGAPVETPSRTASRTASRITTRINTSRATKISGAGGLGKPTVGSLPVAGLAPGEKYVGAGDGINFMDINDIMQTIGTSGTTSVSGPNSGYTSISGPGPGPGTSFGGFGGPAPLLSPARREQQRLVLKRVDIDIQPLNQFELAKVIARRSQDIANNSTILIDIGDMRHPTDIAAKEFELAKTDPYIRQKLNYIVVVRGDKSIPVGELIEIAPPDVERIPDNDITGADTGTKKFSNYGKIYKLDKELSVSDLHPDPAKNKLNGINSIYNGDDERQSVWWNFNVMARDLYSINFFRRIVFAGIPSWAIHQVEIYENTTALEDEYLINKIGLLPILARGDPEEIAKTNLYLSVYNDSPTENRVVRSEDIISDNGNVEILHPDIFITRLTPGQGINLVAQIALGAGSFQTFRDNDRTHAKFNPVLVANFTQQTYLGGKHSATIQMEIRGTISAAEIIKQAQELYQREVEEQKNK